MPNKAGLSTPNIRVKEEVSKVENSSADLIDILTRIKGYKIALKVAKQGTEQGTAGKFGNYKIMNLTRYLKKQEDWIPYINKRKELQRLIPQTIKGANFVPIYDLNKNTNDGIHPNSIGHKIVADKFIDSIQNFKI